MYPLRKVLAICVVLAAIPIRCNLNKKYVKAEVVGGVVGKSHEVEVDGLCKMGSFFSTGDEEAMTVENLETAPVKRLSAETFQDKTPVAVIHGFEQSLFGSGAHREVHSVVTLKLEVETAEAPIKETCELVTLEHLSQGVFADPVRLNRLQQQKAVGEARIYGDADLEQPAKNSFQSILEVHQRLVPDKEDGAEMLFRSEVTMPLCALYPTTSSESHFQLDITTPNLLIYHGGLENVNFKHELYFPPLWRESLSKIPVKTLKWLILSGCPTHSTWVVKITTSAALGGVIAIFMASRHYGGNHYSYA